MLLTLLLSTCHTVNQACTASIFMVLCIALSAAGHAHSYPTKNIRMIVQFAPGGQGDIIARDIVVRWNSELYRILQSAEVRERLTSDSI